MSVVMSSRGFALVRTFRAAFHALAEHKSDAERQQINEVIASHLRSSAPMVLGAVDAIEPVAETTLALKDGAVIQINLIDGAIYLYAIDSSNCDVSVPLTAEQAEQLRRDIASVMAGTR